MIDLHSHILPGIDDGADTMVSSLEMAAQSVACGVTHMVCTPHIHQGVFDNDSQSIKVVFDSLCLAIRQHDIELKISMGSEVRISVDILSWVSSNEVPFIGEWEGRKVLLLELPHSHVPPGVENLIRWLLKNNIQPVIPHPERNRDILADYSKIHYLNRLGCLFQITAGALTGRFSEPIQQTSLQLLHDNLITYVASDTHGIKRRPNDLGDCFSLLVDEVGEEKALELVLHVPAAITTNTIWR